uniref:Myeloid leukemia factor 1 n=1 Tax=Arion vulgaris TaxID=1028688 RepID=A0A0B7ATA3_9EUPU
MLGASFFDSDPFFAGHREQMRQMDRMFMDPFGNFGGGGMLALPEAPSSSDRRRQQQQAQNMQVAERNMFMDPFAHFGSMFSNMRTMMSDMHRSFDQISTDPNAHVYQQQSFMSYSNTGEGAPKVYQASSSSRQGPGGVKETRKTVRDSLSGVEKVAVGHHINDRGHVIERSRNNRTGEQNENQDFINLDEEEAQPFDQEFQDKWRANTSVRGIEQRRRGDRSRHTALTGDSPYHRTRHAALPEPPRSRKSSSNSRKE